MHKEDIKDMYEHLADTYPEMFPDSYSEVENTNDFGENGDSDDVDPAGGFGLRSHI